MDDLKLIKKYYGEQMMHFCRSNFATILEEKGLLSSLILSRFEPSKFLYNDLKWGEESFIAYIYSLIEIKKKKDIEINNTPQELLLEAGYDLYECHSEKDIQEFKKYYTKGEELCTFNGGRLNRCHVFFAVKKNAKKLNRKDFKNPKRQDEYGTSVISIQFSKGINNTLSIKNRYNHTVDNPDATFANNLDNIIPGLTASFAKYYKLNLDANIENLYLPGYVQADDGRFYKYNYEINNIYYCTDNIIIDNFKVKRDYQEYERYIVLDYFVIDLKEKTIKLYDEQLKDAFINELVPIEKINVIKEDTGNKKIEILIPNKEKVIIKVNNRNQIIGYVNNNIEKIRDDFLRRNTVLKELEINNVVEISDGFLQYNKELKTINLPQVKFIGNDFLFSNSDLESINIPLVEDIGFNFLYNNARIRHIKLPNLLKVDRNFLACNRYLEYIFAPRLQVAESSFLLNNKVLKEIYFPDLRVIMNEFIRANNSIVSVYLPNVVKIGNDFLSYNNTLNNLYLEKVKYIGNNFMCSNNRISRLVFPNLETIEDGFMSTNNGLVSFKAPNLKSIEDNFLINNTSLKIFEAEKLESIGDDFMCYNNRLTVLNLQNVRDIGYRCLCHNQILKYLNVSNVKLIGNEFLRCNEELEEFKAPKIRYLGMRSLENNKKIKKIDIFLNKQIMDLNTYIYRIKKVYKFIKKVIIGKSIKENKIIKDGKTK